MPLDIDLTISSGWCTLSLTSGSDTISVKNHWVNDRLTDLVECVNLLLEGMESTSCRWQGPVQEGTFIDLVADPEEGVSVAVHAFRYPEGSTYSEIWSAERGDVLFRAHVPLPAFTAAFAAALRRVRVTAVDASGMLRDYPRPFPQAGFERIEVRAMRSGYHPKPLSEFDDT